MLHVNHLDIETTERQAEADAARAMNPATHLHKEYPGQGFKWVELKLPEAKEDWVVPDKYKIDLVKKGYGTVIPDNSWAIWDKDKQQYITTGLKSEDQALKHLQHIEFIFSR